MLTLRKEQMEALQMAMKKKASIRLGALLYTECGNDRPDWQKEDFIALAQNAIERGSGYGLLKDEQLYRFSKLMIRFGYDFDEHVLKASQILNSDAAGWVKINMLDEWASS